MKSSREGFCWRALLCREWCTFAVLGLIIGSAAGFPVCGFAAPAQSVWPAGIEGARPATPAALGTAATAQASNQPATGSISGSTIGPRGAPVIEALVTLSRNDKTVQRVQTGDDGHFSFAGVAPGTYWLTITASGFKSQSIPLVMHAGQTYAVPRIVLGLAPFVTSIKVTPSRAVVAQYQLQKEEKQLVLGFIPNYLVTYYPHTAPLSAKQKFELTFKTIFNPYTLGLTTAFVGGEQAAGMYSGYGTEEKSFAKRFGAAYATLGVGAFLGDALLPSVLKQDPRFYYKANGSFSSKLLYAITRSVICKGDNGHWQPDYSGVLGHFAAGGIANLYLPPQNRKGMGTMAEDGLIGIGFDVFANVLQEFVFPKLTPVLSHRRYGRP